jgi:hypothetical protein
VRGIHGFLCLDFVILPHLLLLPVLVWGWGFWHAVLFVAYSASVATVYLALELRLIEYVPFSRQADAASAGTMQPILFMGGLAIAIAVLLQHFLIFRSAVMAAAATAVFAAAAYRLARASLDHSAASIRYNLGLMSAESQGLFYKEVDL